MKELVQLLSNIPDAYDDFVDIIEFKNCNKYKEEI